MAHEEEMSIESMMEDEPYSVSLDPGDQTAYVDFQRAG